MSHHGIDSKLLEDVFEESRKFFSLPFEKKMEMLVSAIAKWA